MGKLVNEVVKTKAIKIYKAILKYCLNDDYNKSVYSVKNQQLQS